jgi:UDP-N-acetyl-D-mannosaminuronate dehydrogenase
MPSYAVSLLESIHGPLTGVSVTVLGAAYRGGVKETAFSGVFDTVAELERRGARVRVHDPLYSDDELRGLGFVPFEVGSASEAAILQADHSEYLTWSASELPGISTLLDGRRTLDARAWPDVTYASLGHRTGS